MGRVEKIARELLDAGKVVCKYDLAAFATCDQRTAQRVLKLIHASGCGVRISRWVPIYTHTVPGYFKGTGIDMPKPKAKTSTQRARKRRKDPEVGWNEMMQKRAARPQHHTAKGWFE